ncbi:MAG: DUF5655 domain-containing protein [Blastocatellia bacterium]
MPARKTGTTKKSLYSVHPGVAMAQAWEQTLREKTGRTLAEWVALVTNEGPATEKEQREWLKNQYKLGTNSAIWIVERAGGNGDTFTDVESYLAAAETWVAAMFSGGKAGLRPLYDALLNICLEMGADISICPGKTIVPVYRHHVIAQLRPATRTRLDFGFALGKMPATGRLIDTGGAAKGDRITHRIGLGALADIDDEITHWLRMAYVLDA